MTVTTWPDGATFKACAQYPARHFTDPQLQSATFEPDRRRGGVQAWSGGRATVIRANRRTGGSVAVRFSKQADVEASARYQGLGHYLADHPVPIMVGTCWQAGGLQLGTEQYPILTMDWVPGASLDNYLARHLDTAPAASIEALAAQWREGCRLLGEAKIGHGDVHAGNTLVADGGAGRLALRLVDYDSVWFPGMTSPIRETGHPAFQHPHRAELPSGPYIDAVPNTLTYLSLIALADDPRLWQYHQADDALLFDRGDLADPGRPIWTALLASGSASVARLARTTIDWLVGPPTRFRSLEQALAASGHTRSDGPDRVNVWPPRADGRSGPRAASGPASQAKVPPTKPKTLPNAAGRNSWPPRPGTGAPRRPLDSAAPAATVGTATGRNSWPSAGGPTPTAPPTKATGNGGLLAVMIVIAVLVVIVLIAAAAAN